jgi:diacylglycerol kinase family enzyme
MIDPVTLCVLANPSSGRNSRDAQAVERAMAVFGPKATLRRWMTGENLDDVVARALADGFTTIVAAGGDGTVNGVAHALLGKPAILAVLPLGTFNFFARGLGLPQEPETAAKAILAGHARTISVGSVNGQLFLNNASLGIYPRILQVREDVYARWGRSRLIAYWTMIATLIRFQAPRRMVLETETGRIDMKTPLVFVARSAYQLQRFGLSGAQAISDDRFAVFVALGGSRWHLLKLAAHLALGRVAEGEDIQIIPTRSLTVYTNRRRPRVAFDGEKRHMRSPLKFRIHDDALSIIVPDAADRVDNP